MTLKRALYWGLPSLCCLALYWHGLKAWFMADDFAWLSLHTQVWDLPSLLSALFRPMAQGTVRPLSERALFLGFWSLFGMDALPYRILVFLTQFANLMLLSAIVRRLTRSAVAGFAAPLFWIASPVLYLPMTWTAAYNQILSVFFLLGALFLLIRFVDTGAWRFYAGMWIAFLVGFGALELNVVFPAIAIQYTVLFARRRMLAVAPMILVSVAYAVWHRWVGQSLAGGLYSMDYTPLSLLRVAREYAWLAVSAAPTARLLDLPQWPLHACSIAVLTAAAAWVAWTLWKREWLVVFFAGWTLITLAPYLPLTRHISDYYLVAPSVGLAMLGSWALARAGNASLPWKLMVAFAVLLFALPGVWQGWTLSQWYSAKSRRVRSMIRGVAAAEALHPNKWIVLHGVDDDQFWYGLYDNPEHIMGWRPLYMTAETEPTISMVRKEDISQRFLPQSVTLEGIRRNQVVVYDVSAGRLRNITAPYALLRSFSQDATTMPHFVDASNLLFAPYLKQGWYQSSDGSYRWTAQRAEVHLGGPFPTGAGIRLHGRVDASQTASKPLYVTVSADDVKLGTQPIAQGAIEFDLVFPLPPNFSQKKATLIAIETDRTLVQSPGADPLGLAFGAISVSSSVASH